MLTFSLYVIDDEVTITEGIKLALDASYRIRTFSEAESALDAINEDRPDIILLDIGLPGMSGIETLETIKRRYPDQLVIMITAYEDVETVVAAMKLGAYDYVVKPLHTWTALRYQ
jgi:DNA-binding NtrC family response regulator